MLWILGHSGTGCRGFGLGIDEKWKAKIFENVMEVARFKQSGMQPNG